MHIYGAGDTKLWQGRLVIPFLFRSCSALLSSVKLQCFTAPLWSLSLASSQIPNVFTLHRLRCHSAHSLRSVGSEKVKVITLNLELIYRTVSATLLLKTMLCAMHVLHENMNWWQNKNCRSSDLKCTMLEHGYQRKSLPKNENILIYSAHGSGEPKLSSP